MNEESERRKWIFEIRIRKIESVKGKQSMIQSKQHVKSIKLTQGLNANNGRAKDIFSEVTLQLDSLKSKWH